MTRWSADEHGHSVASSAYAAPSREGLALCRVFVFFPLKSFPLKSNNT